MTNSPARHMSRTATQKSGRFAVMSFIAAFFLTGYLGSVLLLGESFLGFEFRLRHLIIFVFGSAALAVWLAVIVLRYAPKYVDFGANTQVAILATIFSLILVDISFQILDNARNPVESFHGYGRKKDPNYLVGEFYPSLYYPSKRNFRIYKPNISITASSFGIFYESNMRGAPTLLKSTLDRRNLTIEINNIGFRDPEAIDDTRIFALGDSLTFGWRVNLRQTWVKLLQSKLSTPIYNLGIHRASPKQELELLKFLLQVREPPIQIKHLLWMIYEGNDLEDNYSDLAPEIKSPSLVDGTILQSLLSLPNLIKHQSIITKVLRGKIRLRQGESNLDNSHYIVDGVPLLHPLFKSNIFGYKLFYDPYIERAQKPESYVISHPNKPKLGAVFQEMAELAHNQTFDVSVILVPTAVRLQGKYFSGFPEVSEEPHFLNIVSGFARDNNFEVIDLYELLQPVADQQLLYFADDGHLNEEGNRVVSSILAKRLSDLAIP